MCPGRLPLVGSWRNWQTRLIQGQVPSGVGVRLSPAPPERTRGLVAKHGKRSRLKTGRPKGREGSTPSEPTRRGRTYRLKLPLVGWPEVRLEKHPFESSYQVYLEGTGEHIGRVRKSRDTSGSATCWVIQPPGGGLTVYNLGTRKWALMDLYRMWQDRCKRRRGKRGG